VAPGILPPPGEMSYLADWPAVAGAVAGAAGAAGAVRELAPVVVRQAAGTLLLIPNALAPMGRHLAPACPRCHVLAPQAALPPCLPPRSNAPLHYPHSD
jgi:hypothetical protein